MGIGKALDGLGCWLGSNRGQGRTAEHPASGSPHAIDNSDQLATNIAAVNAERARIYRDLHDDIGARLVSVLNLSQDPAVQELARLALRDLREVVYHARGEPGTLEEVMGEIRGELSDRLEQAGWSLSWLVEDLPDVLLPGERTLHLYRIIREATTNAIKHVPPGTLRLRARHVDGLMYIDISDQGEHFDATSSLGSGLQTMRARAEQLGGALELGPATLQGTKVLLRFPLPPGTGSGGNR